MGLESCILKLDTENKNKVINQTMNSQKVTECA